MSVAAAAQAEARPFINLKNVRKVYRSGGEEFVEGARLGFFERDAQADLDLVAKRAPVDHRAVGADDARAFHPVEPAGAGGGRDARSLCQVGDGLGGVVLVMAQDAPVDVVEHENSYIRVNGE